MNLEQYLTINNANAPKTMDGFYAYCNKDGYNFDEQLRINRELLQNKYEEYNDDIQYYKDVLQEYAREVIPLLIKDYKDILSKEIQEIIKEVPNNIHIINSQDSKSRQAAYCSQRKDIYFVPDRMDKSPTEKALEMKGSLIHEILHIVTSNIKKTESQIIETDEDRITKSHYGNYIDEGIVEKSAINFAKQHNLFITPFYGYISNVKLVEFIMQKLNTENLYELWNQTYDEILSNPVFEKNDLSEYNQFEDEYMITYTLGKEKYQKWKEKQQLLEQRKQLEEQKEQSNINQLTNQGPKLSLKKANGYLSAIICLGITMITGLILGIILLS